MPTKPIVRLFVVLTALVLLAPLAANGASSVVQPDAVLQPANIPAPATDDGNLYEDPETFVEGQKIRLTANFPSSDANKIVTIYKEDGVGNFVSTGRTDEANKWGNAYINDYVVNGDQKIFARTGDGKNTEVDELKPEPLGSCSVTGNFYAKPTVVAENQTIKLTGNFPSSESNKSVTFLHKVGLDDYAPLGTDDANKYGNAYYYYDMGTDTESFYALITDNNRCTQKVEIDPIESDAVLDEPFEQAGNGGEDARARATFTPANEGAQAELQVKTIKDGSWKTIKSSSQNSSGQVSFYISDPLEIEHDYRAVSNGIPTNEVSWAGPLLDKDTGLATVHFNSNDGESVNTRTKYFEGDFAMKGGPNFPDCEDEGVFKGPTKSEPAEMKGRGNYSWSFPKKSFSLKLDDTNNLCGLGKSKKWALVANDYDRSLIRNTMAAWVGTKFDNIGWTPQMRPVDLYVNGSYRGQYTLSERVNVEGGRINDGDDELKAEDDAALCDANHDDITGTYLMEWDYRKGAEYNFGARSSGWVGLKEPEDEDYCSAMGSYINNHVDDADAALMGSNFKSDTSGWKKYIDLDSAVDYYLAMEFLKPVDGNMWASVYMYKPRDGKIKMGPLWDFDLAEGSAKRAGNVVSPSGWYLRNNLGVSAQQTSKTWFNRLNEDPDFRAAVKQRWNEVDQDLHPSADIAIYRNQIAKSANENFKKWNHGSKISKYQVVKGSWGSDVEYVRGWLESRNNWMNSQLDNDD